MPQHIRQKHGPAHGSSGYSPDSIEEGAPLPDSMARATYIPAEEEEGQGIPQSSIPAKFPPPDLPASGSVAGQKRTRGGESEPARKRKR